MSVDKEVLERWIKSYQCGDFSSKQKIIDELAFYIRHFPRMAYRERDEDVLSDFYLFCYNGLDRVLRNFDEAKSSFWTYLSKCLVHNWYDFKGGKKEIVYDELPDKLSSEANLLCESMGGFSTTKIGNLFEEEKNIKNRLILKLYFFDYFEEQDLILLKEITNKSYEECLELLDDLMEEILERRQRHNALESRITGIQAKILAYQRDKKREAGNLDPEKQHELDAIQDRYIKLYRGVLVNPSYKTIGQFFQLDKIAISNIVHRFKYKIKKQYQKKNFEEIIESFY